MCSIFGILGEYSEHTARRAFSTLAHRGVDASTITSDSTTFLAHHHLKIAVQSSSQPKTLQGITVLFNGEIYNTETLRQTYNIAQRDEVTIIAKLFLILKERFVHELDGMFAIAIKTEQALWLFRDRFGKKPLYYMFENGTFSFASEIKALAPLQKRFSLNQQAVHQYFSLLAPVAPLTFYEGIFKIPAGAMLHFNGEHYKVTHYYNVFNQTVVHDNETDALVQIEQLLDRAIHKRHYEPQALLLSGGLDSSLLCAKLDPKVTAYSLYFKEFQQYDESAHAMQAIQHTRRQHKRVSMSLDDYEEGVSHVLRLFDEPINDPAAVALWHLLKTVHADGYRVVQSGEGSDEIFLGYRHYYEYLDIEQMRHLGRPAWLKKYFRANFSMSREWEWYKRIFEDDLLFRTSGEKFTDLQQNRLFRKNVRDGASKEALMPLFNCYQEANRSDTALWMSGVDLWHYQSEHFLAKLDRTSMFFSIEARAPYLDDALVSYLLGLKHAVRVNKTMHKHLLKKIAAKYLPESIVHRKKRGFATPYLEWLIKSNQLDLIEAVNEQTGIFNRDVLSRYIQSAHKGRFKQHIWGLYLFSRWLKERM